MKTYVVGCNCTEYFNIKVEAQNEVDAILKATEIVAEHSVPKDADVFDREFMAVCAEEINQ